MSGYKLISLLENLVKLHKSLNKIAIKKTDILKSGDIDALQPLLKEENKHVLAIRQLDQERSKLVEKIVKKSDATLSSILPHVNIEEREQLQSVKLKLTEEINKLRSQNSLNQKLIEQSLSFVNLSMDLLMPEPEEYVYDRPDQQTVDDLKGQGPSIFDSKA